MDKRFFLALLLTAGVLVVTPIIFPRSVPTPRALVADSSVTTAATPQGAPLAGGANTLASPSSGGAGVATASGTASSLQVVAETVSVGTPLGSYAFSTLGAAPIAIQVDSYPALNGKGGRVVLKHGHESLLRYRVVTARDTIAIDRVAYTHTSGAAADGSPTLTFVGTSGSARTTISYVFSRDNYLTSARVAVEGITGPAFLLVDLPTGLDTQEADSAEDIQNLAYSVKPVTQGARGVPFTKLDEGEKKLEAGPLSWAVMKSKYFIVGLLAVKGGKPFAEANIEGGMRSGKRATRGIATVVMPLDNGAASFEMYAGPLSWLRLLKLGRDFETANPTGGFLQPVVQPFATIVMRMLLGLKKAVNLNYGWVIVIFGVAIRLVMWPLNQSAMRSALKMQRIQPELQEVQTKFKSDPQKQQSEIMRVYKEHDMSPFSAFTGCLPALLPMPVLMALFYVFRNTIEFRGVPFLWLRDISLHDPLYALPLAMGASMYLMSWISLRNAPPNPQAKMMSYIFPVFLTVALANSAAGLSLYYTVQNLAALPQQWLIANERAKAVKPAKPAA